MEPILCDFKVGKYNLLNYRIHLNGILLVERIKCREDSRLHNLVLILHEKPAEMGNFDTFSEQNCLFKINTNSNENIAMFLH